MYAVSRKLNSDQDRPYDADGDDKKKSTTIRPRRCLRVVKSSYDDDVFLSCKILSIDIYIYIYILHRPVKILQTRT